MERFLAVYAHEGEAMDIEPVVLPVTYSSRAAFLEDLMMAARDAKAAHEVWQHEAAPYLQALLQNMLRRFNQEPVTPSEEIECLRPPGPEVTGAFTFCGHDFHWKDFYWEDGGCYKEDLPRIYGIDEFFNDFGLVQT
jgi:hypothetical protein